MPPGIDPQVYSNYIGSAAWSSKRQQRLRIDGHRCVLCHATTGLHVHHSSYNNFTKENVNTDLVTLCSKCHGIAESTQVRSRRRYNDNPHLYAKNTAKSKSSDLSGCLYVLFVVSALGLLFFIGTSLVNRLASESRGGTRRYDYSTSAPRATFTPRPTRVSSPTATPRPTIFNVVSCKGNKHTCKDVAPVVTPEPTKDCKQGWMDNHGVCVWDFAPTRDLLPTVTPTPKG